MITLYTIGFTKKSAEQFFNLLKNNNVKQLVDVRISNSSQLAGFAKGKDLEFFVKEICHIPYRHITDFAPSKELLDLWHKQEVTWEEYEKTYIQLLKERNVLRDYGVKSFDGSCFLCSEDAPEQCHRRLLAEYLQEHSKEKVTIVHLI
ncbi:MAG: DUF488 domain-containing protein [Bacteroidales bacterium]|nr:DUF488 domain-containing protein [Bacteroidales bacterium]MBR5081618.1 DUF488 domain-containing protein [Bacteroidales bacterium]